MEHSMSGAHTLGRGTRAPASSVIEELRRDLETSAQLDTKSLNEACSRLGMSPRTLQRRLGQLGTSFSAELEQARKARALRLVTTTERPLAGVAKELGFADASTFSRAFLRWFARPPGATRASPPSTHPEPFGVTGPVHAPRRGPSAARRGVCASCTHPDTSLLLSCAPR